MNAATQTSPKPAARTAPRLITVVAITQPHPEITRVIFSGEELRGFPSDKNGAHIKLFFPKAHQVIPQLPTLGASGPIWPEANERPITRTYSVRYYDARLNHLAVDFAIPSSDQNFGPAHQWLSQIAIGQKIGVAGPGGPDPLIADAQHQIFIGDTSALAALWALNELPFFSQKYLYLIAESPAEFTQDLSQYTLLRPSDFPSAMALHNHLIALLQQLIHTQALTKDSQVSGFIAGENSLVLRTRDFLKSQLGLNKKSLYAIPYWHCEQNEEAYHQARHTIMDEVY